MDCVPWVLGLRGIYKKTHPAQWVGLEDGAAAVGGAWKIDVGGAYVFSVCGAGLGRFSVYIS